MIYTKDHKTPDMFDRFPFLGPKRKQRIEASWAKIFREHILPTLPVERVFSKYDPVMGAPTKERYYMLFQGCSGDFAVFYEPELLFRIPPSTCRFTEALSDPLHHISRCSARFLRQGGALRQGSGNTERRIWNS
jgi:hypothetical protein